MTLQFSSETGLRHGARSAESAPCAVVHTVDIDDHVRLALQRVLAGLGMELQAHAHLSEFLRNHGGRAGCLVIDAESLGARPMPWKIGCPIIVTAGSANVALIVRAMKAGAIDVVETPPCERKLAAALAEAIEIDRRNRLEECHHAAVRARFATLTSRERQVMGLVTAGKLNKQAGGELGVCEITVKAHRGSVMRKMGARSLAELVRMADLIGMAPPLAARNGSSTQAQSGAVAHHHICCIPVQN